MQISALHTYSANYQAQEYIQIQPRKNENGSSAGQGIDVSSYKAEIVQFRMEVLFHTRTKLNEQSGVISIARLADKITDVPESSLDSIGNLTPEDAQDLISENGFFGIDQTSRRLADFVIKGVGENLDRLRDGREGILRGFQEAEEIWGSELPEISYKTLVKALETIDERIRQIGGSVLDVAV